MRRSRPRGGVTPLARLLHGPNPDPKPSLNPGSSPSPTLTLTLTLTLALALTRRDYCKALEATLCEVCAPTLTPAPALNPNPNPKI